MYSAQKLDHSNKLVAAGNTAWLVSTVLPKIDDLVEDEGIESAVEHLKNRLLEDYNHKTRPEQIESRPWFGRCVYESDSNVCDDQTVTILRRRFMTT